MQEAQPNLFTRPDTFFGVCEGLGEDLGIHSNWLRLALAGLLFFSPLGALIAYAVAGVVVLATRLLVPNPRLAVPAQPAQPSLEQEPAEAPEPLPVPLAA